MTEDDQAGRSEHKASTQKDLATKLGLSPSTISLALRNNPRVAKATRDRVQAAMLEDGYVPDATASALRTGKTGIVGVSLHDISHHFFADMVIGIEEALTRSRRALLINYHGNRSDSLAKFIGTLISYKADGLILSPASSVPLEMLSPLRERGVPIVYLARHLPHDEQADRVIIADQSAFKMATRRLIDLGHRNIVMLGGGADSTVAEARAKGFFEAMKEAELECSDESWIRGAGGFIAGTETMARAFHRKPQPTGYVCISDLVAFGAMAVANGMGLRPGRDAGFVGFGDTREGAVCFPKLTSVRVGPIPLGERAAELLTSRIDNPSLPPVTEIVETELVVRTSCGPPVST